MHRFFLKILTPDKKLWEGEVTEVVLPTKAGEITILANHIPLISLLSIGQIKITDQNNQEQTFLIQGGVVDVKQKQGETNKVVILADEKLDLENFNLQNFEESLKRAKNANQEDMSDYDPEIMESLLERSAYFKNLKNI